MVTPPLRDEHGQTISGYLGVLLLVVAIIGALMVTGIGGVIGRGIDDAICAIIGGDCESEQQAQPLTPCLESSSTTSSSANVLVAVVRLDKDSILIRQDYSDESAKFTILDGTEVAGELFAGVRGKVADYGIDYALSGEAGLNLKGAKVFELSDQPSADAFQESVDAAGGFDGLARDVAEIDNHVPFTDIPNPLGYGNDLVLDVLGVDSDEELPTPDSEYIEARLFLKGNAGAGAGLGIANAEIEALIRAAGTVKRTTSGESGEQGDVEITLQLDSDASAELTAATLGGGGQEQSSYTATLKLDAQNGYRPSEVEFKGVGGYSGSFNLNAQLQGNSVSDVGRSLGEASISGVQGAGQKIEFKATLPLNDPRNRDAALDVLLSGAQPARLPGAAARLVERFDQDGTLEVATFATTRDETEGELRVGLGVGGGGGASQTTSVEDARQRLIRYPGGGFELKRCLQGPG
jgi:hypothetical protein